MNNEIRFDLEARAEVWVNAMEIRAHPDFAPAMMISHPESRLAELKAIALLCAKDRIAKTNLYTPGIEISAYPSLSDVNIDRINWQELATESHV
jgi:hypothetical protein